MIVYRIWGTVAYDRKEEDDVLCDVMPALSVCDSVRYGDFNTYYEQKVGVYRKEGERAGEGRAKRR